MTTPSWQPDPARRHEHRWWDGAHWTDHVTDHGVVGVDPLGPPAPAVHSPPTATGVPLPPPSPVTAAAAIVPVMPSPPGGQRRTAWIVGAAVAVAALVVGLVVVTGGKDDTDGASGNRPVATDTDRDTDSTDTRTTDSDDTVTPDTVTPDTVTTTVPGTIVWPSTVPTAAATTLPPSSGEAVWGTVAPDDEAIVITLDLAAGQVLRARMESSAEVDGLIYVMVDEATVDRWVAWAMDNLAEFEGQTADEVRAFFFSTAEELWPTGDLGTALQGTYVLFGADSGYEGDIEALFLTAAVAGRFTVVITSWAGVGNARAIVQVWDGRVDPVADAEQIIAVEPFDDPWFTEPAFFTDAAPYPA